MAPHSSTLAWKIPWTEEPGGLQSMGLLRVGHDWATSLSLSCIGEGNGNPLQCSCLENPRDRGAWWAAVYGTAQSRTRLKWLSSSSSEGCDSWEMPSLQGSGLGQGTCLDFSPYLHTCAGVVLHSRVWWPESICFLNKADVINANGGCTQESCSRHCGILFSLFLFLSVPCSSLYLLTGPPKSVHNPGLSP